MAYQMPPFEVYRKEWEVLATSLVDEGEYAQVLFPGDSTQSSCGPPRTQTSLRRARVADSASVASVEELRVEAEMRWRKQRSLVHTSRRPSLKPAPGSQQWRRQRIERMQELYGLTGSPSPSPSPRRSPLRPPDAEAESEEVDELLMWASGLPDS